AYEIDHKPDGTYHLLQFDAEPATLNEIARVLKITDGVMRHMATRRVKGGTRAAPPPLPAAEAAPPRVDRTRPEEPEAGTDVAEPEAEEYAEPTAESEAPEAAPEEEL